MLGEVCVKFGYCEASYYRAARDPDFIDPRIHDVDEITDAIFVAEGIEPWLADRQMRRSFAAIIDDWLFSPRGRGAQPRR